MVALNTIKMKAKGQLVIPSALRRRLGLVEGSELVVFQRNNALMIKTKAEVERDFENLRSTLDKARAAAKRAGMKRSDITAAIKRVRAEAKRKDAA